MTGQTVTDISQNVFANLAWEKISLPKPVFEGDTIRSRSTVLGVRESNSRPTMGMVTVFTEGYNQRGEVLEHSSRKRTVGLGRNCTIFETARVWAYREIRHHWGDEDGLGNAITERVHEINTGFSEPLPTREARDIAKSIHRWIITESRMWADGPAVYEATFTAMQAARGRKGGIKSGEKGTQRRQERAQQIIGDQA